MSKKNIAERIFDGELAKNSLDARISELLEEYYPDINCDYNLRFDWYDGSIEIDFQYQIPYPWEPNIKIRKAIKEYGFNIVYWNFPDNGDGIEEIRGNEPRRIKLYKPQQNGCIITLGYIYVEDIGYVDHRFNKKEWMKNYGQFR